MVATDTSAVHQPPRPARPSTAEIDAAILDAAAETFARHGYAGTSVQQVADAVGYSKTGLLRRFPSKQALYEAVVEHVAEQLDLLVGRVTEHRRDTEVVMREVAAVAFAHPGAVLLMLEVLRSATDLPGSERLDALAHRFLEALTLDFTDAHDRVRALLALQLVTNAAVLPITPAASVDLSVAQLHELSVELACTVLGAPARR